MKLVFTRTLVVVFSLFLLGEVSFARSDEKAAHQMTATPSDARFVIIQSERGSTWTFRLDRYTGSVYQLINGWDEGPDSWEQTLIEGLPRIDSPTKPRFILFTSGNGPRWTYLMDTSTGKTWSFSAREMQTHEHKTTTRYMWQPVRD